MQTPTIAVAQLKMMIAPLFLNRSATQAVLNIHTAATTEVAVTKEVVITAAGNWNNGKEIMALLLEQRGSEVEITNEVVAAAANSGQEDALHLLEKINGVDFDKVQSFNIARLYKAAKSGEVTTLRRLVEEGVPFDNRNVNGETPLWQAAPSGQKEVVQLLLATNAVDVNVRSNSGHTPIFWASAAGEVEIVQMLLGHGAEQHYTDKYGESPLSVARSKGPSKVVDILVQDGTNVSVSRTMD
jgi:ankyrin repeat protein